MMSNEGYRDRVLTCRDCNQEFTFSAGEQEFFSSKGLTNTPSRCPSCRAARRGSTSSYALRAPRGESYETTCANCGRSTTVPFIPSEGRAVYCSDCFQAQRASRPRRDEYRSYGDSSSYDGSNNYSGGRGGRERGDRRNRREYDRW